MEKWKPVPGFGGHYEASSLGRFRVKDRIVIKRHKSGKLCRQLYHSKIIPGNPDQRGYLKAHIGWEGKKTCLAIHRAVALAWHGEPPNPDDFCRHLDGNNQNNVPRNLAWGTHFDNMQDRKRHGRYACGENHHMNKFTDDFLRRCIALSVREAGAAGLPRGSYYRAKKLARFRR